MSDKVFVTVEDNMRISLAERERLAVQTDKLVKRMISDNNASYQYGSSSVGEYTKQKRQIEKYNAAMREFISR